MTWAKARAAALERDGCCQLWERGGCWGGLHVHHRLPRSRGGSDDLSNLLTVCAGHHDWIHGHPAEARDAGFTLRAR